MNWRETESLEEAARRLIGVMDERAKKRLSGRLQAPEKFQGDSRVPSSRESAAPNQSNQGVGMLDGSAPIADAGRSGGSGLGCGQVACNRKCRPLEGFQGSSIACPLTDADTIASGFSMPDLNGKAHRRGKG